LAKEEQIFNCGICYCDYDLKSSEFKHMDIKMLSKCNHAFCGDCFTEYYRSLVEDQYKMNNLKCPQHDCKEVPSKEEVEAIMSKNCF